MSEFVGDLPAAEAAATPGDKTNAFIVPQRQIFTANDFEQFKRCNTYMEISGFVKACADAVIGKKISDSFPRSPIVLKISEFMKHLHDVVNEIPPIKQPMRFGNKAFRDFHKRLCEESIVFARDLLPEELKDAAPELAPYLNSAFGNETRIDYGTGHELSFVVFLLCLYKLELVKNEDLASLVLVAFTSYIKTMRRLQVEYMLEPAGSHGVWGLDDYHILTFLWGAAQLVGHPSIVPSSIHDSDILREYSDEYLYLEAISFIRRVKASAPFEETSPMLNDISGLSDWAKIYSGLGRQFQNEVLNKMPVAQHLLFGSLLPHSWVTTGDDRRLTSSTSCGFASGQATKMPPTIAAVRPVAGSSTLLPGLDATTVFAGHPHPHSPNASPSASPIISSSGGRKSIAQTNTHTNSANPGGAVSAVSGSGDSRGRKGSSSGSAGSPLIAPKTNKNSNGSGNDNTHTHSQTNPQIGGSQPHGH